MYAIKMKNGDKFLSLPPEKVEYTSKPADVYRTPLDAKATASHFYSGRACEVLWDTHDIVKVSPEDMK